MTTKEQRDELRKCPFCGMEPIYHEIEAHSHLYATFMPDHGGSFIVECVCGCGLIASEKAKVIEHWNTRAVLDSQQPASVDASVEPVAWRFKHAALQRHPWTYHEWSAASAAEVQEITATGHFAQPLYLHPPAEKGQADERTYEDGLLRAAEICRELAKDQHKLYVDGCIDCEEAIEQEAKGVSK